MIRLFVFIHYFKMVTTNYFLSLGALKSYNRKYTFISCDNMGLILHYSHGLMLPSDWGDIVVEKSSVEYYHSNAFEHYELEVD